jgi:hypothetical protein
MLVLELLVERLLLIKNDILLIPSFNVLYVLEVFQVTTVPSFKVLVAFSHSFQSLNNSAPILSDTNVYSPS